MRIEKRYFTFMGEEVDDIDEAECAERQEYEDAALAIKKVCKNIQCEECPFNDGGCCLFYRAPRAWNLDYNEFHSYDMELRYKNHYGMDREENEE